MRLFIFFALLCLLMGCRDGGHPQNDLAGTQVQSFRTIAGPASQPPRYTDFSQVAPLFEQRGDTTFLINFWATWCKPCIEELPLLQRLADTESDIPLQLILVSLDTKPADVARVPDFLAKAGVTIPSLILSTEDTEWGRTFDRLWSGSLPTTLIYRNELQYVYRRAFATYPDLRSAVTPLLQ